VILERSYEGIAQTDEIIRGLTAIFFNGTGATTIWITKKR
jgi:hypothetical protein